MSVRGHSSKTISDSAKCSNTKEWLFSVLLGWLTITVWTGSCLAATIYVPNGSFESPETDFAGPQMDGWQKAPQPIWYNDPMFPWEQLMGQFLNTSNGAPNHIDNVDGRQAAFLFALPQVGIFQDYNTISGTNSTPAGQFNAQFEAGKSYALTVGVLGGGGGMSNGATFQISLYFRDAASNMVTVGATTVTNSKALFPTNTLFTDFQVRIPCVKATDAWAGKRIGIQLASTVGFDLLGGYWDVDNVRLTESVVPNYSFELPESDFANPFMDAWQKAPQPVWYNDTNFPWAQLVGQFLNTSNGSPNHIDNEEGLQAAYLFALPDVAIFQDYNTLVGTNQEPAHQFDARFEVGKSYALTVGVLGGGGGMSNGATFQISFYYRDASSNIVTVAATTITNSSALFPTNTHFIDFQARVPHVKSGDAWAGKNIGIRLASTTSFDLVGGYWDIDNVRLAESVLPNNSFESPDTDFAVPAMDAWQKAPPPVWYTDPMFPWEQLMGQFLNTSNDAPNHIDNADGKQGAFLFALPDVAIFQDYISVSTNATTAHDFNLKYEVGNSYSLTVGVLGGGGGMSNGALFAISFYYRDAASNKVTVALTTITNTPTLFPTNTHLTDFNVQVPTVKGSDGWAGKQVGVQLASTTSFALTGGYWDVDNVRLQVVRDPVLKEFAINSNQQFQFALHGAPGRYEVLSTTNLALPAASWISLGIITNFTGSVAATTTNLGQRFYQVRTSP
jgi:thiamine pyrophosphokinase